MEINHSSEEQKSTSISDLLRSIDARLVELDCEGEQKLLIHDVDGYDASQREQTKILANLADEIETFRQDGGNVPTEVYDAVLPYSGAAQHALAEGRTYSRIALFPLGSRVEDPSLLEQLATKSQPLTEQ